MRLLLGAEPLLTRDAELRTALLLSVAQPPPVECVQLAQHEVQAATSGLELVVAQRTQGTSADDVLVATKASHRESQLEAATLLKMFANCEHYKLTSADVISAVGSAVSVELLDGLTIQMAEHLHDYCSTTTISQQSGPLPLEVQTAARWLLHTRLPLRVLHPNPVVNTRLRRRMQWFVKHSLTKPSQGSKEDVVMMTFPSADLVFQVALFNTSVAAFVLPPEDHQLLRLSPPPVSTTSTQNKSSANAAADVAARSAAATVANLTSSAHAKDIVSSLYQGLRDALVSFDGGAKVDDSALASRDSLPKRHFVCLWFQHCIRLLIEDAEHRSAHGLPALFKACCADDRFDTDQRREEGIVVVREWMTSISYLSEMLSGFDTPQPPTTAQKNVAASPSHNATTWSHITVTVLVTLCLEAAEIPSVEHEMSALIFNTTNDARSSLANACSPANAHLIQQAVSSTSPIPSTNSQVLSHKLSLCLSKVRRWCSDTFCEASNAIAKEQSTMKGSFLTVKASMESKLNEIQRINQTATTPHQIIISVVHDALDIVQSVITSLHPVIRFSEASLVYKLWSATVALAAEISSDSSFASRRPPEQVMAAVRRIVEHSLLTPTPPLVARGATVAKLLQLASLHDRLTLRAIPAVTTVATLRAVCRFTELLVERHDCHSMEAQSIVQFMLGAFQLYRDVVSSGTVGWSTARARNVDGAYTALLDVLVTLARVPSLGNLGSSMTLRIVQEAFGFQVPQLLFCIQNCFDRSHPALPTSKDIAQEWGVNGWGETSTLQGSASKSDMRPTLVTAAAFLYFFSGRWRPASSEAPHQLQNLNTPCAIFEKCVDEYARLVKQEVGRTRGVPEKKRHLLPPDGFANRLREALLSPASDTNATPIPVLRNPLQLPSDASITKAIRMLTAAGQYAAVTQIFLATHPFTFLTSSLLLDVLQCASCLLTQQPSTTAEVRGYAFLSLWLLNTTYQSLELPPAAALWLIAAEAHIEIAWRDSITSCIAAATEKISLGSKHISRRVALHLCTSIWCRILNHFASLPPLVALNVLGALSLEKRRRLLMRIHTDLDDRSEEGVRADEQRLQLSRLVTISMGAAAVDNEISSLTTIAQTWTWRRAAGLLTSVSRRVVDTSATTTPSSTGQQLIQLVIRATVRSSDASNERGTPAKALWSHGKHQLTAWILSHIMKMNNFSDASKGELVDIEATKSHIHGALLWLQFLRRSLMRDQWSLTLQLGAGACRVYTALEQQLTSAGGAAATTTSLMPPEERHRLAQVAHKAAYTALEYLLERCDLASRSPIPATMLSKFLRVTIGHPPTSLQGPSDETRAKAALRLLARHPRVSWAEVVHIWQSRLPARTSTSALTPFPPKLALTLFENLKNTRQYTSILRIAAALDMGPHRDENIHLMLTEAATMVVPRAVDDMLLSLRGQLVARTVDDIISEQDHTQQVESVSFLRRAVLAGNWVAALQVMLERPMSIMSSRFTDACNALASKSKGFSVLPLVETIIRQDMVLELSGNGGVQETQVMEEDDTDALDGGDRGLSVISVQRSLVTLLSSNGDLLDALLQCYASTALFASDGLTMSVFSPVAAWLLRARILSSSDVAREQAAVDAVAVDGMLRAIANAAQAFPRPNTPILEGSIVNTNFGVSNTHVILWELFGQLIACCEDLIQWKGRAEKLSNRLHRVRQLLSERADIVLELVRLAISVRPHAAVVISQSSQSFSQECADALSSSRHYAEAYLAARVKLQQTVFNAKETQYSSAASLMSQRDVALFAPAAVGRWIEAVALVAATRDHMVTTPSLHNSENPPFPSLHSMTDNVLRRVLLIASQSSDPSVVVNTFRSLTSAAWGPLATHTALSCIPEYLLALQRACAQSSFEESRRMPGAVETTAAVACDPFLVWSESVQQLEALAAAATGVNAASHWGIMTSIIESLLWCLRQEGRLSMFSQNLQHGRGQFSSTGLWSLILRCATRSTLSPQEMSNTSVRARLGTSLLTFAGHLCDVSAACATNDGGRAIRSLQDEVAFWRQAIPTMITQVSSIVGTDCIIPQSVILSQRQTDAQMYAVLQMIERSIDVGVDQPLQFLTMHVKHMIVATPRSGHFIASNEESFAIMKLLCVRVAGSDWQLLLDDLLGAQQNAMVSKRQQSAMLMSTPDGVDSALQDKIMQQQLLHMIAVSTTWVTALTHVSQHVNKSNQRVTSEALTALLLRMHKDVCDVGDESSLSLPTIMTSEVSRGVASLTDSGDARSHAFIQAATDVYYHAIASETLPTTQCIEVLLKLCTKMFAFEAGLELLQSLSLLPLPRQLRPADGPAHTTTSSSTDEAVPYAMNASTQITIAAFLEAMLMRGGAAYDSPSTRQHLTSLIMWLTRFPDHDVLEPRFVEALLRSVAAPLGGKGSSEQTYRATAELMSYVTRHANGNVTVRSMSEDSLRACMAVIGKHSGDTTPAVPSSKANTVATFQRPIVVPARLAERLLTCVASLPQLHIVMAGEYACSQVSSVSTSSSLQQHNSSVMRVEALATALRMYRVMIHDSSPLESRALASAIPTSSGVLPGAASLWLHAMSLLSSFAAHALPSDDPTDDDGTSIDSHRETSVSLLSSLHNACDVLVAEGKWKRALACGHTIAKVHSMPEIDPFVLGSVASYFAQHSLFDAGRSVVQQWEAMDSTSDTLGKPMSPMRTLIYAALHQQK
ncbi:Hypothetical protein, putative [Bodo saltans]|uniref:Uncharacterized protein n=1 Tax=Bodo saltans TaxID=75058 RepID=A0A0S4KI46_BODSA|nr:Hypothetical protein, putative [Bodo saltans]|eukprot:CUI14105.1 Hypothetical protein, putative [Bodo saltans]